MYSASVREVQHNLAALLRRVEQGDQIEIRFRRRPVARIVPIRPEPDAAADWSDAKSRLAQIYCGRVVGGTPASDLVAESRGDR
jgi:prevent-host-death family protein